MSVAADAGEETLSAIFLSTPRHRSARVRGCRSWAFACSTGPRRAVPSRGPSVRRLSAGVHAHAEKSAALPIILPRPDAQPPTRRSRPGARGRRRPVTLALRVGGAYCRPRLGPVRPSQMNRSTSAPLQRGRLSRTGSSRIGHGPSRRIRSSVRREMRSARHTSSMKHTRGISSSGTRRDYRIRNKCF